MAGIAQVWLTEDELIATLEVLEAQDSEHPSAIAAHRKLSDAYAGVACEIGAV